MDFEKYLQSQEKLQKRQIKKKLVKNRAVEQNHAAEQEEGGELNIETNEKKGQKRNSPLKKSILLPKKRPKKEKLGTHSSDNWW
jgi:dimeric dUTPase (all-alpha-NTP-PPase superfamily)